MPIRRIRPPVLAMVAGLLPVAAATGVHASGFQVRELSAAQIGTANAGIASDPRDMSIVFTNPAGMTRLDRSGTEAVANLIWPRVAFSGIATDALGRPTRGTSDRLDDPILVPAAYAVFVPQATPLRLGFSLTVPYGLGTEYREDWIGRYNALRSNLETINLNLSAAAEPAPGLSVAFGVAAQRVQAELTNAVDFGALLAGLRAPGFLPQSADGLAEVEGDDWGWGWNAGLLYEPVAGTRFGLAVRSRIGHELSGEARFRAPANVRAVLGAAGVRAFEPVGGVTAGLTTPMTVEAGASHEMGRIGLHATAAWTDWSVFREIRIRFENPAQPDAVDPQFYRDTWFLSVGATYDHSDTLSFRAGIAHDGRASQRQFRTPRIPDEERTWLAVGLAWAPTTDLAVDAGWAHIFVGDAAVDVSTTLGNRIAGTFDNRADVFSVSARWRF